MKTLRIRPNHSAFHKLSEKLALQAAFYRESQCFFEAAQTEENAHGYNERAAHFYAEAKRLDQLGNNLFLNRNVYRDHATIYIEMQKPDELFAAWEAEARTLAKVKRLQAEKAVKQSMYSIEARAHVQEV